MSAEILDLLNSTFFLMPNWKWLALIFGFLIGLSLRPILQLFSSKIRNSIQRSQESKTFLAYLLRLPMDSILSWIGLMLLWLFLVDSLKIHEGWDKYLTGLLRILLSLHVIRLSYLAVDAIGQVLLDFAAQTESTLDDRLAPFATKTLKVLVVVMGVLITLQNFKIEVMSLLAGLGLGGLALALAAQDTAANLFGSIMILIDNPFHLGDHIKIGDTEGIVEEVGFRSTRIRTFANTLVTLPNSVVAKEKIENLGIRQARRVRQILGLHYDTPPEKINQFCEEIKYLIGSEALVQKDNIVVCFNNFNASSLDILVNFHINTLDVKVELEMTQKIFTEIWKLSKKVGVDFAYPTQTLYLNK